MIAIDPDEADFQDDQTEQLMFSMPNMLNNRHLMQKHWTYKRKRLRSEKISQKKKINANSEADEFSCYSEVWCQSEGRRRHTYAAERAG